MERMEVRKGKALKKDRLTHSQSTTQLLQHDERSDKKPDDGEAELGTATPTDTESHGEMLLEGNIPSVPKLLTSNGSGEVPMGGIVDGTQMPGPAETKRSKSAEVLGAIPALENNDQRHSASLSAIPEATHAYNVVLDFKKNDEQGCFEAILAVETSEAKAPLESTEPESESVAAEEEILSPHLSPSLVGDLSVYYGLGGGLTSEETRLEFVRDTRREQVPLEVPWTLLLDMLQDRPNLPPRFDRDQKPGFKDKLRIEPDSSAQSRSVESIFCSDVSVVSDTSTSCSTTTYTSSSTSQDSVLHFIRQPCTRRRSILKDTSSSSLSLLPSTRNKVRKRVSFQRGRHTRSRVRPRPSPPEPERVEMEMQPSRVRRAGSWMSTRARRMSQWVQEKVRGRGKKIHVQVTETKGPIQILNSSAVSSEETLYQQATPQQPFLLLNHKQLNDSRIPTAIQERPLAEVSRNVNFRQKESGAIDIDGYIRISNATENGETIIFKLTMASPGMFHCPPLYEIINSGTCLEVSTAYLDSVLSYIPTQKFQIQVTAVPRAMLSAGSGKDPWKNESFRDLKNLWLVSSAPGKYIEDHIILCIPLMPIVSISEKTKRRISADYDMESKLLPSFR